MTDNIYLIGPLTMEYKVKVKNGATLMGDRHIAKNNGASYGGSLVRITRFLRNLGCFNTKISAYLGNDYLADKILEILKEENIEANVQKIPSASTPITFSLHDKHMFSSFTTAITDLYLWQFRIKNLPTEGIFFIDPATPSAIQAEIIAHAKNGIIVLRKPLDNDFSIFDTKRKLIVLLNEYEAMTIFTTLNKSYFEPHEVLQASFLAQHTVIMEERQALYTMQDNKLMELTCKTKISDGIINDYFIAGLLASITAKQDNLISFIWGLSCALNDARQKQFTKMEIKQHAHEFEWQPVLSEG